MKTSGPLTPRKEKLIRELSDALQRLVDGNTNLVTAPYKISQKTVCDEADRHRSSIKTSAEFIDLRAKIEHFANSHQDPEPDPSQLEALLRKNKNLKAKLSEAEATLDSALLMIYELNRQAILTEENQSNLRGHISRLRSTNESVDKAFRVSGFDRLLATMAGSS